MASDDTMVILLLNVNLPYSKDAKYKPFTLPQWNKLAQLIKDSSYKGPSELLDKTAETLMSDLYIDRQTSNRIVNLLSNVNLMKDELSRLKNLGIEVVTRADREYPFFIKSKLKEQAPSFMFYAGDLTNLTRSAIGVVGSRDADEHSLQFTRKLVTKAVDEGLALVSGGARGIDVTAQDQALAHGGTAISILHSDLEVWVKKKEIQKNLQNGKLTLLTAVHPKARFQGFNAMGRNKYIYTHSKSTFVVASSTTGGTWEGAVENIKNGWVPLFVRLDDEAPTGNKVLFEQYKNNPLVFSINLDENVSIVERIRTALKLDNQNNIFNGENKNDRDIYPLILPILKQIISEGKSTSEISKELNVNLEQVKVWVDRYLSKENNQDLSNDHKLIQGKLF